MCQATAGDLSLTGAAMTLMVDRDTRAVIGASDGSAAALEGLHLSAGEGPGLDAFLAGRPVLIADLSQWFGRWPLYVSLADAAGVAAVFSFPLQLGAMKLAVLTCYSSRVRTLTTAELALLLEHATLATSVLLTPTDRPPEPRSADRESPPSPPVDLAGHDGLLHLRGEVYQAQGMVAVQLGVGLAEALTRMRAYAFARELDLTAVALGIVAGTVHLAEG